MPEPRQNAPALANAYAELNAAVLHGHEHVLVGEHLSVQYVGGDLHLHAQAVTMGYFCAEQAFIALKTAACGPFPIGKHNQ